jgi:Flp pilus assembly protein TadG
MARNVVQNFRTNEQGAVAILFGLMLAVCATSAGIGLDYSRILHARHILNDATDAAALAVGRAMLDGKMTEAEAVAVGDAYFAANTKSLAAIVTVPVPTITTNPLTNTAIVTAQINLPMGLMAIAGFKSVTIPSTSTIAFDAKDLEVGMALDITGSMAQSPPGGGPAKIDGLKKAFTSFAETLIPETPQLGKKIRVGIAPFSAAVNLGKYAKVASSGRSKDGCVTERAKASYSDQSISIGGDFDVAADGIKNIDPTEGGVGDVRYFCPGPSVIPLTDKRQTLIDKVQAFQPGGFTAGHLGIQWGWNLISENYASFWGGDSAPAPYADIKGKNAKLVKAVIIMTDGIFNTAYHSDMARKQALAMCTAMKDEKILVFTIGFGLGNTGSEIIAKQTLKDCATPGALYFADASNATELDAALQSFASTLGQLRITQ